MTSYPYLPLRPEIHEIRLLSLQSAPSDDKSQPWALKLVHASLDSDPTPSFAALSYVWGNPSERPHITVDNHTIAVTQNLHSALARLHRQGLRGYIWIDALCINQSDTAEKNVQVGMMARIYGQAEQVIVWLGPEPDYGALRAVRELGVLFREQVRNVPGGGNARIAAFVKTVRDYSLTGISQTSRQGFDFEAIWRFFRERSWWRRVWIIQEVVLAREALVLCGEDIQISAPWADVRECMQVFEWMVLNPSTAVEHRRLYEILGDIYPNIAHLGLASDGYKRSLVEGGEGCGQGNGHGGMSLLETIMWTSFGTGSDDSIQATDPRDKIYGLLGMMRLEDRQKIPVDYSPNSTLGKILFAVAKVLLEEHGPDILSFCRETSLSAEGLPSWVPNWTAGRVPIIGDVSLSSEDRNPYDASKGSIWSKWASRSRIKNSVYEEPVISFPGIVLGNIGQIGRELTTLPTAPGFLSDCRDWLFDLRHMIEKSPESGAAPSNENHEKDSVKADRLENIWKVAIADFGLLQRPNSEDTPAFLHGFRVLMGQVAPPSELDDEAKEAWVSSQSWGYRQPWKVYGRRAFVDSEGRPGLGPKNIKFGDIVVVFAGGHVPFIIRRQSADSQAYCLLGPAYLYGLMDGEAMANNTFFSDVLLI